MMYLCPTCRQEVVLTRGDLIAPHLDSLAWEECPSSREPFYTVVLADPELMLARQSRRAA